jgi:hypothetical protein
MSGELTAALKGKIVVDGDNLWTVDGVFESDGEAVILAHDASDGQLAMFDVSDIKRQDIDLFKDEASARAWLARQEAGEAKAA